MLFLLKRRLKQGAALAAFVFIFINSNMLLAFNQDVKLDKDLSTLSPTLLAQISFAPEAIRTQPNSSAKVLLKYELFGYGNDIPKAVQAAIIDNEKVIWQGSGLYTDIVFSNNGNAILVAKVSPTQRTFYTYKRGDNKVSEKQVLFPEPIDMTFHYHGHTQFLISNDAQYLLSFRVKVDDGLRDIKLCTLGDSPSMYLDETLCWSYGDALSKSLHGYAVSNLWLGDNNELYTVSYKNQYQKAILDGKTTYQTNSFGVLSKIKNGSVIWQSKLSPEVNWESVGVEGFSDLIILKASDSISIFSQLNGEQLWSAGVNDFKRPIAPLYKAFIEDGVLIMPSKNGVDRSIKLALGTVRSSLQKSQ
ncbi:hypothetical protein [Psychrosphaera haliotis]|uniref:Uncharacterized protein n=1 Tax=Psychrosphaera haliotis TaxID=555083 RepID=A0A6N8F8P9_9GAMM|nr:hypothetical protein [Psychrosphaera haliotis]MUH71232.1 hypothetical protein [Psychrosphaera haliotis]